MGRAKNDEDKNRASASSGNARLASKFVEVLQGMTSGRVPADEAAYLRSIAKLLTDGINAEVETVAQAAHRGITCVAAFMPMLFRSFVDLLHKDMSRAQRETLMAELDAVLNKRLSSLENFLYHLVGILAVRGVHSVHCSL